MAEEISAQIRNYGIPIQKQECIGDTLEKINNSFTHLGEQSDLINENLALSAASAQRQIDFSNTRINQLSAPLVGDIVSAPWTTQTRFLSTRYNNVVPSNKGGAGSQFGFLSANGSGVVVGLGSTPISFSSTQSNQNDAIVTFGYIQGKLASEFAKLSSLNNEIADRISDVVDAEALANTKIKIPAQNEWPSNTFGTAGYVLTYDPTSIKTDKWVPKSPAAPPLIGAITSNGFNTIYNQIVPADKGGAGSISGILSANGLGLVVRAIPGEDYVLPSDLNPYVKSTTLNSYAEKSWVSARFATIPELTATQRSWIQNPLVSFATGQTYSNQQFADGGNSYNVFGQESDAYTEGNVLTLIKNNQSPTGHMWISRPPAAPTLTGAITSIGGYTLNGTTGFNTTYAQVVPSNKGGAGTINGILKADGNGNVSKAQEPNDYLIKESVPKFANYLPISSLKIDESFRNNSLIKYDDYQKTWRIASPEDEPFAEVNFIYGLASQHAGWYSGCAFSERRVIAWGQLDGKGRDDHFKFSQSNSLNYVVNPNNYTYVPFHSEYDNNGNVGNNIHFFDLARNKKARILQVIWNWSCAMAWVRDDSRGGFASGATSDVSNFTTGPSGCEDTIWVMGTHKTNAGPPSSINYEAQQQAKNGHAVNQFVLQNYQRTEYIDNTTGSIGISGNGGGTKKATCGFVQVKLPGFPRVKQINVSGHPSNGKWIKEQIIKIQCKCDPGIPNNFDLASVYNDQNLPSGDPIKRRTAIMKAAGTALSGTNQFNNYILWGALTNFGNLYVWGRSRDGCFGLGNPTPGTDLQINSPHLVAQVSVGNDTDLKKRNFAGAIADFEYTSAEFDATSLGVITLSGYDLDWPDMFPDVTAPTDTNNVSPTPHQALYFAGDNEHFQCGVGTTNTQGEYWPASTDYFLRSQKMVEIPGSNQYGLCTQSQIAVNASLNPTYITDAKKIVRSLYGGRVANGYIDMDGRLWTCGSNAHGLLGNCGYVAKNTPDGGGDDGWGHYSYGTGYMYREIEVSNVSRLVSGNYGGTGQQDNTILYDRVPQFVQEYPFRATPYPAGEPKLALTPVTNTTGTAQANNSFAINFRGRGYFCEAKVHTWQDEAPIGTSDNNIRFNILSAVAYYNKRDPAIGDHEYLKVTLDDKLARVPGSTYIDPGFTDGGNGAQTVTLNNYRPRPKFIDAYFAGMNCPYLMALAEIDNPNSLLPFRQYNLYACGQNSIITFDPDPQFAVGENANKAQHGYLGIDSAGLMSPRLLPCVYKREVKEPADSAGALGELVKDKVRNAIKIFSSDTNGTRNISHISQQSQQVLVYNKSKQVGSSSTRRTVTWNEYFKINTVLTWTNATYANLGANAFIDQEKLAYINGYNTFNDPPDYDSTIYQYYTRMPINNVEDLVLGGDLESHTYQFFRTTAGIVWGMGKGASNVLGAQNDCYLPVRII